MRFNRLDLNLLVALDALLTECSISRAAERVHVSQSSMSHMLARLREHFGDELLVQVGRKMTMTPRAEALQEPIRDVLVRINTTIDVDPVFDCTTSERQFSLRVSDFSMRILMPPALALAQAQHSKARFRFMLQLEHPFRALERGEVDLLIIPEAYRSAEHPSESLFTESFVGMVWSGSQHAGREMTMDRFIAAQHIVAEPGSAGSPSYEEWFLKRYGISRNVQVGCPIFTAIPALLVGTEMVAIVHARVAREALQHLPLKTVPLPVDVPPLVQHVQWHKHRSHDPGIAWVRRLLHDAARQLDPVT